MNKNSIQINPLTQKNYIQSNSMQLFNAIQIYAFKLLKKVAVLKLWRKKCAIKSNRLQILIHFTKPQHEIS